MSQEDIVLNGVSINELKRQRTAIQKDATKLISELIADITKQIKSITIDAENRENDGDYVEPTYQELEAIIKDVSDKVDTISVVSGVSGVTFFLPYYEEYGDYSGEILSSMLEDSELDYNLYSDLYDSLYDLESESRNWHSSTCY